MAEMTPVASFCAGFGALIIAVVVVAVAMFALIKFGPPRPNMVWFALGAMSAGVIGAIAMVAALERWVTR
jgi:hypothetical protein